MFNLILSSVKEPPVPEPTSSPETLGSPLIFVLVVVIILAAVAWKFKAFLEFILILALTVLGFILGIVATPTINLGLGIAGTIVGMTIGIAISAFIRLVRKSRAEGIRHDKPQGR